MVSHVVQPESLRLLVLVPEHRLEEIIKTETLSITPGDRYIGLREVS